MFFKTTRSSVMTEETPNDGPSLNGHQLEELRQLLQQIKMLQERADALIEQMAARLAYTETILNPPAVAARPRQDRRRKPRRG